MLPRKNSKDDEINTSNYCLFDQDSPKNENNDSNKKIKKLENPKSTIIKRKKNFNVELNQIQNIDIDLNNLNIYNKDNNDTFSNFKLFEDSHRGNKINNNEDNNKNNNK